MTDRVTVYTNQVPYETDVLKGQKNMYIGIAKVAGAILGTNTLLNGLPCTPTAPPSLQVQVGAGEIYSLQVIDATPYGVLPADTIHSIVKTGIILDTTTFSTPAPVTVGYSINYLIEVAFNEADINPVSRPYFNSADPTSPIFLTNSDTRQDQCVLQIKAGTPAPTGTQVTPAPDPSYTGAWVVTVAHGQTTVTSGDITVYPNAPFITETLTQKISQATADTRYVRPATIQSGQYVNAVASGTDTYVASLTPAITSLTDMMEININFNNTNTIATPTLNLNATGALTIANADNTTLFPGQLNSLETLYYNQALNKWIIKNLDIHDFSSNQRSSPTVNGYQILPGGLIMQWMKVTVTASHNNTVSQLFNFPIAFPNSCFNVQTRHITDPNGSWANLTEAAKSANTTSVTVFLDTGDSAEHIDNNIDVYVFAVGN